MQVTAQLCKAYSRLVPSQWEMSLQSNAVSHWLGANLESALTVCLYEVHYCRNSQDPLFDYVRWCCNKSTVDPVPTFSWDL